MDEMENPLENILLVEDNVDYAELIEHAVMRYQPDSLLMVVYDGQEALDYLYNEGEYNDPDFAPRPSLVLLDLKLPKIHGIEVLKTIKGDRNLREIPVCVLTTSTADTDVEACYAAGANAFITKPSSFTDLQNTIMDLVRFASNVGSSIFSGGST